MREGGGCRTFQKLEMGGGGGGVGEGGGGEPPILVMKNDTYVTDPIQT